MVGGGNGFDVVDAAERGRRQRERKKKWFIKQRHRFVRFTMFFLYIFLPSLHDHNVKMPNFTFHGGRKQATNNFSFA